MKTLYLKNDLNESSYVFVIKKAHKTTKQVAEEKAAAKEQKEKAKEKEKNEKEKNEKEEKEKDPGPKEDMKKLQSVGDDPGNSVDNHFGASVETADDDTDATDDEVGCDDKIIDITTNDFKCYRIVNDERVLLDKSQKESFISSRSYY